MTTAHIICGSTGAGKTTYSLTLKEETGGILFTLDDWMQNLFFMDAPEPLTFEWAIERVERCEKQMLKLAQQIFTAGNDIIMDLGFFKKEQRQKIINECIQMGANIKFHYLPADADTRWRRVEKRNNEKGNTFSLHVNRDMFKFCEDLFEEPNEKELEGAIIVRS